MVNALISGLSGPSSSSDRGHCVVFLQARHFTLTVPLPTSMDWHPIQGGVEILLVASCFRNWDKLRPDGPLGLNAATVASMEK